MGTHGAWVPGHLEQSHELSIIAMRQRLFML